MLGVKHRHMGPLLKVLSERLLVILFGKPGTQTHILFNDPKNTVFISPMLYLYWAILAGKTDLSALLNLYHSNQSIIQDKTIIL